MTGPLLPRRGRLVALPRGVWLSAVVGLLLVNARLPPDPFRTGALIGGGLIIWCAGSRTPWREAIVVFGFLGLASLIARVNAAVGLAHPMTFDGWLANFDHRSGDPAFWLGRRLIGQPWLNPLYQSLPVALAVAYIYSPARTRYLLALVAGGALATFAYSIIPAAGPLFLYERVFPQGIPHAWPVRTFVPETAWRDAMPSMHVAWSLTATLSARRPASVPLGLFTVATAVVCLATGQHYSLDILAAVPFAIFVWWLAGVIDRRIHGAQSGNFVTPSEAN